MEVRTAASVPTGNVYDKYGGANAIERRLVAAFLERLDRCLPVRAPGRVLEVGVGEGEIASRVHARYPAASVVGLDLADDALAEHWSGRGMTAAFGDIASLPFADRAFGLVLAIEVLEHVADPHAALRELARVARADVVLSVPREPLWRVANMARGKYWRDLGNTPGHVQHWGRRAFASLVREHLDVTAVHSPTPWTMVAARVRT
jgi:ubiquinone/menaquinone biosynthesis C-methylase UbiE